MDWISVKDRMPVTTEEVLITDSYDGYAVAYWNGIKWCAHDDLLDAVNYDGGCCIEIDEYQKITHWIPLPEPPK